MEHEENDESGPIRLYHDGEWYVECHPDEFDSQWEDDLRRAHRVYWFSVMPFTAAVIATFWSPPLGIALAIIGHILFTTANRVITQVQLAKTSARLRASNYAILKIDLAEDQLAGEWVPWAHGSIEALLDRAAAEDDRVDPTGRIRDVSSDDDDSTPILH